MIYKYIAQMLVNWWFLKDAQLALGISVRSDSSLKYHYPVNIHCGRHRNPQMTSDFLGAGYQAGYCKARKDAISEHIDKKVKKN